MNLLLDKQRKALGDPMNSIKVSILVGFHILLKIIDDIANQNSPIGTNLISLLLCIFRSCCYQGGVYVNIASFFYHGFIELQPRLIGT